MRGGKKVILTCAFVILSCWTSFASLWNYDSASADIKEYVIDSVTNCVLRDDIVLLQRREYEPLCESDKLMPGIMGIVLGLQTCRFVEVLKGNRPDAGNGLIYLYRTQRLSGELPDLYSTTTGNGCRFYMDEGRMVFVKGKDLWRFSPPYDPLSSESIHEYVELRFLSSVKELKRGRINARYYRMELNKELVDSISHEELAAELGVMEAFSNCVYQSEEGCVFQVDFLESETSWTDSLTSRIRHEELVRKRREKNSDIMHLSSDEVSEIVYLSYLADKRYTAADYDAACRRCPKILKPVKEFKTEIGKRLKAAMESGGMLPKK